ncbi:MULTISPECIES: alpha/beta hydrolase [Glycomyces]|uniref:Alpha/beta hydrolase n=2 Tax=Glycomyces TaxID=58113 RepID=A0A9X3PVA6_9ACTN|nr:alpha/beta hydrolase [Glycomyces lechevalierae]MDA1386438.1 alpha/beta hydrolase [Glycomyces lechevalierae]MDR7338954.1 arylformamidase [Glycomyces lechevalierae]
MRPAQDALAARLREAFPEFGADDARTFAAMLLAGHGPGLVDLPEPEFLARVRRDRDYSPSRLVPDAAAVLDRYAEESRKARETVPWKEIAYGDDPMARIDLFPADGPLLIYIHGGYWQELDKSDSAFMVPGLHAQGVTVAVLGYGLAPRLDLDAIVAMVRAGVRFLTGAAGSRPVYLAGSSAGAHLAAMCLPDERVSGAILLSGVYDLEPLVGTYINGAVGMDEATARRNSPLRLPIETPPSIVARGEREPAGFSEQHEAWLRAHPGDSLIVQDRNHFDLPLDLGDPSTTLGRKALELMGVRP